MVSFINKILKLFRKNYFICNICGQHNYVDLTALTRENQSCCKCLSNVRLRSITRALQKNTLNGNRVLAKLSVNKDIKGVGLSDDLSYSSILSEKVQYVNTYYHMEPQLDITSPKAQYIEKLDFVISKDVFEHVLPPVQKAFDGAYQLLKPGGHFVFSVPYSLDEETKEHFPNLHKFEIVNEGTDYKLINITETGEKEEFKNLIFHGGPGTTLEMRLFSKNSLLKHIAKAGFKNIKVHEESDLSSGILIEESWSLTMSAEK